MKLQNNSKATLIHDKVKLLPGEILEFNKDQEHIAKIFLCYEGVVEYADPKEVKAKEEKLEAEKAELKAKIAELEKEAKAKEEKLEAEKAELKAKIAELEKEVKAKEEKTKSAKK